MESDERTIRELHAHWIDAVNAGDLAGLLGMMTEDAVFLSPGQPPVGRDGFSEGFSQAHRHARIRCLSEPDEVVVLGEVAYTRCRDALAVTPRSGGPTAALAGHRLSLYRRQSDGRWLLARDAHTLSPVAHAEGIDERVGLRA